ncbi:ATP-grasp domain-containing protein [Kutzneria sp. NPDC052558]|uniref:ATP-grasp domain-containing protein n=1 Tax=Kutzneria sp. NPDC052558 TaxID=3364121 RepID=UPI0037C999F0
MSAVENGRVPAPAVVLVDALLNGSPFKRACDDMGFPVVGVYTIEPSRLAELSPTHAAGDAVSLYGDRPDLDAVAEQIAAIVPATEPAVYGAAVLAGERGLPSNPLATAQACRDKYTMRELAAGSGVRVPSYRLVSGKDEMCAAIREIGVPTIVKPTSGAGSHNVFLVREERDMERIAAADRRDLFGGQISEWLVEEYVRGREFAVNMFSADGEHILIDVWEYYQPDSRDYDNPYWQIAQLDRESPVHRQAEQFARQVLAAFDVRIGPSHVEMKLGRDGMVLMEIGARLPGGGIPEMWERTSRLRPYHDTLAAYLGRRPELVDSPPEFTDRLGICFIRNEGPAGVLRLDGVDEVRRLPGVLDVSVNFRTGDHVQTTRDLGTELVKLKLAAPTTADLARLATQIRATIVVDVQPVERAFS